MVIGPPPDRDPPGVLGISVHRYHPRIGGSELHARCIAEGLAARGWDVVVHAAREAGEPRTVGGFRVEPDPRVLAGCDVVLTYSVSPETIRAAGWIAAAPDRPRWLHHPCGVAGGEGLRMVRDCDVVVAMNPKDVALALAVRGREARVVDVPPASHPSRVGGRGEISFRRRFGVEGPFILWIGAWLRAKGPRSLSLRFAELRRRRPALPLKLVMFGGYGRGMAEQELPAPHPDILVVEGDFAGVPAALGECAFLAFNSPPHPVGFDANPLVLIEAMMNGKTFIAQAGTPLIPQISHLGLIIADDEEWVQAATKLLEDDRHRRWLERRCRDAHRRTYNLPAMIDGIERAIATSAP